jgi:hypothetical protein
MEAAQTPAIYWPKLTVDEKAFVAAYTENAYSLAETASALSLPTKQLSSLLNRKDIRCAISEVQTELDSIDFLNDKWVKSQLLRLFPKVMGDEAVPMVNNLGEEYEAKKFMPDIAMRIVEYVAPKTTAGKANGNSTAVQVNIDLGALGIQRVVVDG